MAIFGNLPQNPIDVGTSDTTIINVGGTIYTRIAISALSLHNTTGASITVELYHSPDATSASGERVANVSVPANSSEDVNSLIGQAVNNTRFIVAVGDAAGCNALMSYTGYTEDD